MILKSFFLLVMQNRSKHAINFIFAVKNVTVI